MHGEITFDRFIRWVLTAAVVVAVIYVVGYLSGVLLPFFIAWLLAYLLYPGVKFVQYRLHVPGRVLSIIVTVLFVAAVIGMVVWLIIPPMFEQFGKLGDLIGDYVRDKAHTDNISVSVREWLINNRDEIERFFRREDVLNALQQALPELYHVLGYTATIVVSITGVLMSLMYLFFILLDYEYLTDNWIRIFPKRNRPFWKELMSDVEREMNNYIRGQALVALCMGILFCIGFTILDFPMAIGLGIMIGIMDLVPYLHTFALIPTAFLALLKAADTGQDFWMIFLPAVALFVIIQLITEMVLNPRILGKAMRMNPAILLLSLSVWGALLGFVGLIIALPMTTILIAYYQRYVTRDSVSESGNAAAPTAVPAPAVATDNAAEQRSADGEQKPGKKKSEKTES